ncbi:MAG TPA: hypothetical protein VM915_04715, partial [Verrucomicrobiae bacterium]|nr:hypothetical protein [Verrucomicrobiae bacterium]
MANPLDPPFEIPPIITYAVPAFVLLIIIEMIYIKLAKKGGRYDFADSATSLSMGFGNRVFGVLFGALSIGAYFWVYQF